MINYPIGEIFQETGIVSPEQLKAALHVQKASRLKLGEILVKLNFVTYTELARVVAMQKDLDYVDLHASVPEDEALTLIDQETALNNALIPMRLKDELLHVVTANPDDDMRDYLQTLTGKTVRFEVSDVPSIAKFVQFYYGQLQGSIETKIETLIESANNDEEIDIIELSELIIENAVKDRATDIHIIPELLSSHVFYRIDGVLQHYFSLPTALHHYLITRLKVLGNLDIVENLKSQSGEFEYHFLDSDYSVRISAVPTMKGEKIAMRLLPENFMLYSMEDLGFEEAMIEKITAYLHKNSGMVLIIGPSGSGKTTTLYSMLRKVNILERNVLSIEEPVEFQLPFVSQLEVNHGSGM
ncbi:MAG: ATPase, T2SS/T4P/T4SS family, partial [Sulfurimonadaceae bacterium]|nr:ATPase, T2SS/T4P/T4SS family [Sulfurimonadaceae bacterium]